MMHKKGQSMSINVIIIAILGVLVLVILAVIFTSQAGIFSKTTQKSCIAKGGLCVDASSDKYGEIGCGSSSDSAYIDKGNDPNNFCKSQLDTCCIKSEFLEI